MSKALDSQRTYALIGTGGCGKTSLAEMLLFQSGVINRLGAIEEGTTTLDYEPEEIKRRGSIQPGFATFLWNKDRHFLMDVPGDTNFTGDLPYLLMGGRPRHRCRRRRAPPHPPHLERRARSRTAVLRVHQ